jgi:uncharacterized C2H2 Zn-finger protein
MRPVDPTEWANKKKAAMERAKQLREERKNAVNENDTFQPQLVARKGSNASNVPIKPQDSLDKLATNFQQNDIPIKPMKHNPYTDSSNSFQELPSPGSDALGKELKKYGNSVGEPPQTMSGKNNKAQFQSKFMQQYDQDQNHGGYSDRNPEYQKPQKNPDDEFMNFLRSDSKAKSVGPGWNDDTTSNGFDSMNNKKPSRRAKPVPELPSNAPMYGNTNQNKNNYYSERDTHYSRSAGNGDNVATPPHNQISPRTAPHGNPPGNATRPSPRDPVIAQARSSLSLLKSKIKLSGTGNLSETGSTKSNNNSNSYYGNDNGNNSSNYSIGYSHNESSSNNVRRRSEDNSIGYEPSQPQTRNPRIPPTNSSKQQPSSMNQRNNAFSSQPDEDSDEENVVTMVPRNRQQQQQQQAPPARQQAPPKRGEMIEINATPPRRQQAPPPVVQQPQQSKPNQYYSPNPAEDEDNYENEENDPNAEYDPNAPQLECPDCGRKFNENAYPKHVKICAKVFMQKRKKFDSKKMRMLGDHVDPEMKKIYEKTKKEEMRAQKMGGGGAQKQQQQQQQQAPVADRALTAAEEKAAKWKQQSEAFRNAMKAARQYTKAKERGEEPPPPVISAPDPSLIPCPHCGRRFNEMAANRHIPQCQNIKAKPSSLKRGSGINAASGTAKTTQAGGSFKGKKF